MTVTDLQREGEGDEPLTEDCIQMSFSREHLLESRIGRLVQMEGLACAKQEADTEVKCLSLHGVLLTAVEFQAGLENPEAFLHLPTGFVSLENLFSRPEHAVGGHKIAFSSDHVEFDPIGQFPLGLAISPGNVLLNGNTGEVSPLVEPGYQGPAIIIQALGNFIAEI